MESGLPRGVPVRALLQHLAVPADDDAVLPGLGPLAVQGISGRVAVVGCADGKRSDALGFDFLGSRLEGIEDG